MSDNRNNLIVGYSGHALVVADAFIESGCYLRYYTEKKRVVLNPFDLEYIGDESDEKFAGWGMQLGFILGIGDNYIRGKIGSLILSKGQRLLNVIHPSSSISKNSQLSDGIFIARGVMVNALARVHNYVILNTGCIIEHECVIDNAAHIAPGAVLAGNVRIGKRTFIGANSVIKQGVVIGDDVIIGAGSVVIKDIPDKSKYVGNPAKKIV